MDELSVKLQEPYPSEHSARIESPEGYDRIRRSNDYFKDGIHAIFGVKDNKSEIQAIRFDKNKYTVEQAKQWLKDHKFETIKFETASESDVQESLDNLTTLLSEPGRVISGANEKKIRDVIDLLQKILQQLGTANESGNSGQQKIDFKESQDIDIVEETPVQLKETKLSKHGIIPVKIISPGWGSSGYYPKEVLERDAPKYSKGTLMFWDHPTAQEEKERPEGSLTNVAAKLTTDGIYKENGEEGAGIYAHAKVYKHYQNAVSEMGQDIGISHRAFGRGKAGKAEGKEGFIIEAIKGVRSVDFVTIPGAGGKILNMFESYRSNQNKDQMETIDEKTFKETQDKINSLEEENKRLKEIQLLRETSDFVNETLKEAKLPDITKNRLCESLSKEPVVDDKGELDKDKMKATIEKAVENEITYLSSLTESGKIKGLGESENDDEQEEVKKVNESLTSAFNQLLGDEDLAKVAAEGRN